MIIAQSFVKQLRTFAKRDQEAISLKVIALQAGMTESRHKLHKVDGDAGWWSAYVNGDLRIILQRPGENECVVCWVDHHDAAYRWARNHTLAKHPATGVMQLVEVQEVVVEKEKGRDEGKVATICEKMGVDAGQLLAWGIPEMWVERVLGARDEDELLEIGEYHLPADAAEVVLKLAVGERPEGTGAAASEEESAAGEGEAVAEEVREGEGAESAKEWKTQEWWVVTDDEDLKTALEDANWDSWCVYLHPSQKKIAYRTYEKAYRVCGSAGTGKTVVALHHARHIVETDAGARVLIATYSENLARDLDARCRILMRPRELERCEAKGLGAFAEGLYKGLCADELGMGKAQYVMTGKEWRAAARQILDGAGAEQATGKSLAFLLSEMERIIEPRQIRDEQGYVRAKRRGVKTRLAEEVRRKIWRAIEGVHEEFRARGMLTPEEMFGILARFYREHPEVPRYYSHAIIDESQDLCEVELEFLTAYFGTKGGRLFFAGDVGQRIIRYSFPWKPFGIDLRGCSRVLKVNYRTTRQIRQQADKLMVADASDADDVRQDRTGTISLLAGPAPEVRQFVTVEEEVAGVAKYLDRLAKTVPASAVAIFVRNEKSFERAWAAVRASAYGKVPEGAELPKVYTMFEAKGLEYRAAVVMACDSELLPDPERLEEAGIIADMDEIYDTERNLLYVACTRAREYLLITCGGTPSSLLLDLASARVAR